MLSLLRLERKQKIIQIHFEFAYFSFFLTHLELKQISSYTPAVPSKTIPDSRPKWAKSIPFLYQNGAKTLPDGAAHTYIAYIKEYPPWVELLYTQSFGD